MMFLYVLGLMTSAYVSAADVNLKSADLPALVKERAAQSAASRHELEASRRREGSLQRSFVPEVKVYAASESFKIGEQVEKNQPVYGAEVSMNLFNGGKDALESEARSLARQKQEADSLAVQAQDLLRARELYWSILFSRDEIKNLETSLGLNRENLKMAQRRISGGLATQSDRFEFEMREVDLKRSLAKSQVEMKNSERELKTLLRMGPEVQLSLSEKLDHEHDFEALIQAPEASSRFLYQGEFTQAEIHSKKAAKESREFWPKLDVYAGYNQFNEREKEYSAAKDRTETAVGLRLSAELGRGWESQTESRALELEAEAAKIRAERKRLEVDVDLENRRAELRMLHDQVHEAEENIKRAESYYKLTQSEYSRGVKNSPDVLGASEKLLDRRQRYLEILRNFQMGKAEIYARIGK